MDISNLTIDELVKLRDDVAGRLVGLIRARQNELKEEGERLDALNGKTVLKPKYVHPDGMTWHGRGSKPKWVEDWLSQGRTLEQLKGAA